ncbi:MAG TPA: hypothetical protein VFS23_03150 [Vicinamibacterales bacterium]|nr:hypothetical protein [Vicinamibacterales bacterium]
MSSYVRRANEAYHTIDSLAGDTLARAWPLRGRIIWEPCAGRGELVRQLERHGATVTATELHAYPDQDPRIAVGVDFFETTVPRAQTIVMNPPYNQASRFIKHALDLIPEGCVVALLRHDWICRQGDIFAEFIHAYVPIRGRLKWVEGPTVNKPRHNFAWVIWGPESVETTARFIP